MRGQPTRSFAAQRYEMMGLRDDADQDSNIGVSLTSRRFNAAGETIDEESATFRVPGGASAICRGDSRHRNYYNHRLAVLRLWRDLAKGKLAVALVNRALQRDLRSGEWLGRETGHNKSACPRQAWAWHPATI